MKSLKRRPTFPFASAALAAVSLGDPGGIGVEVVLKALARLGKTNNPSKILLIGSLALAEHINRKLGIGLELAPAVRSDLKRFRLQKKTSTPVIDLVHEDSFLKKAWPLASRGRLKFQTARVSPLNGLLAVESVRLGAELCLAGEADALVTAPLHKEAARLVIPGFSGHTDWLKALTRSKRTAMMFVAGPLRVTLATVHLPLREVADTLSTRLILEKIELTRDALKRWFGIRHPRIGVSSLNPHGSEFGREEKGIIGPAILAARKTVPRIGGPISGDEIFRELRLNRWDAIIAMYHDQGLAPFKAVAFREGVNVTLGLPFVRTSPDHGTAFDIAGRDQADERPMLSAIRLALDLAR